MTEINEINVPALRKALEHITAHPEEWNQGEWAVRTRCGTAYCLAGTVAVQAGYEPDFEPGDRVGLSTAYTRDDREIEDVAMEILGLTEKEADLLFEGGNSLFKLWYLANHYSNGEIEIPVELADLEEGKQLQRFIDLFG